MRRVAIAAAALSLSMAGAVAAPYEIKISDGRPDAMYRLGETCRFTLRARDLATNDVSRGGIVKVKVDNFGERVFAAREWNPAAEPVLEMSGTMDEPGFLRVVAMSAPRQAGALWALGRGNACWSVGFEPERIRPGSARPADFDAYWDGERARLAREVPPDFRRERVDWLCDGGFDVWKVSAATFGGKRTWGFLVEPKGLSSVPLPLYVNVPGAGPALSEAGTRQFMKPGEIHLIVNVHPYEPAKDFAGQNELYKAQDAACAKKYGCNYAIAGGAVSREEFFFHDALLGIDRVLSWAVALPEVDRGRVRYRGGSQGGGMGIALCAINPAIGRAVFQVPAITDLCGFRAGRQSGWPLLVERQKNPAAKAAAEAIAPYFDAVHFAPRVKIPLRVEAGLSDTTCPPPCVYAAFNAFGSTDKKMVNSIGCGHGGSKENRAKLAEWLRAEDGAGPRPFVYVCYGAGSGELAPFAGLPVFTESMPVYSVTEGESQRLRPFTKHQEYRKKYVRRIPDGERRKTPYNVTDLLPDAVLALLERNAKGGRPFFVYERISRPPYFLPSDGCPLADRGAFAEWKAKHPGFLGFNSLWELDSDTTYFTRFWDNIDDKDLKRDLQAGFEPPRAKGRGHLISWVREMFRRARDFHWGEQRIWPMCSNHMGFEHLFAANGATGLWYEATTQSWGAWNCASAFLRGAARQWGLPCGWYMAQYYTGFTRGGEFRKGDSRWYDHKNPDAAVVDATGNCPYRGEGRSQHRRQALYGWLIGADYMQTEGWSLIYRDWKDGRAVPSENAFDINEVYMLSKIVARGEPYTPLAVLTPLAEPSATSYRNDDLLEPDTQRTIFNTLVPIASEYNPEKPPDRKRGEQGCLFNSRFPGFFDALCPDAGQDSAAFEKALSRYRHVLIAGDAFDKEKFDSRAIAAFEKAGGKVHRYPSPECPTKEKLRELLLKIQNETMPFAVEGDIQWGVNKTSNGWLVYLINNKGVVKFCDEPEEFDMSKTAHVVVTVKSTGERREVDIAPGDFKLLEFPFSSTER